MRISKDWILSAGLFYFKIVRYSGGELSKYACFEIRLSFFDFDIYFFAHNRRIFSFQICRQGIFADIMGYETSRCKLCLAWYIPPRLKQLRLEGRI